MSRGRNRKCPRRKVGQVSYYRHHGSWYVYYRRNGQQVRRRVGKSENVAKRLATQINSQLSTDAPTAFDYTPANISELRRRFLDYHENVLRSSPATCARYRTATLHLERFASERLGLKAHTLSASEFVIYLRSLLVSPNGHGQTQRRPLRDKGVVYILEVCRSMYRFAAAKRLLPPYSENPFSSL